MLYERWREVARQNGNEIALHDLASGERWTFSQLAERAERAAMSVEPIVFPQGRGAPFIFKVLEGWRAGKIICPVEEDQAPPKVSALPKNCAHLKTTSATTGNARFVVFTEEQLAADAANIIATMGLRREWPNLGVISLAHSYGFSNLVTPLLLHGIPLVLLPTPLPEVVRRATLQCPAITLAGVPALWRTWFDAGALQKNVRLAISAGAPLSLKLEQEIFARHGLKVHNFYGSSECGAIAYDSTEAPREDAACAGSPVQNVKLSLDENGCLEVRSPAVGETYFPESDRALAHGRFQTTDLAEISGGKIFLRGRMTDQINVAGRKVSPETIERALLGCAGVRQCVVFGVPSEDERTDMVVAMVATDGSTSADVLKQSLLAGMPAWQIPREWIFVDFVESNARGKVSRAALRQQFLTKRAKAVLRD